MNENGDFKSEYKCNAQPFNGHLNNVDIHFQCKSTLLDYSSGLLYHNLYEKLKNGK